MEQRAGCRADGAESGRGRSCGTGPWRGRLFDKAIRHRRTHGATTRKDRREPVATGIAHHGVGDWLSVERQDVDLPVSIKAMQPATNIKTKQRLVSVSWKAD